MMEILLHNAYKPYFLDYRPIANLFLLLCLVFSVVLSFFCCVKFLRLPIMIIIMKILTIMYIKSSINKVSSIRVLFFFYIPYIYKNRVLAYFQTRPNLLNKQPCQASCLWKSKHVVFDSRYLPQNASHHRPPGQIHRPTSCVLGKDTKSCCHLCRYSIGQAGRNFLLSTASLMVSHRPTHSSGNRRRHFHSPSSGSVVGAPVVTAPGVGVRAINAGAKYTFPCHVATHSVWERFKGELEEIY